MDGLENRIVTLEKEMSTHEMQCEERWKTTFNRLEEIEETLGRMESRLLVGAGSMILFLAGVIASLLMGA